MKNRIYNACLYLIMFGLLSVASAYLVFFEVPTNNVMSIILGHIAALSLAGIITLKFRRYRTVRNKVIRSDADFK